MAVGVYTAGGRVLRRRRYRGGHVAADRVTRAGRHLAYHGDPVQGQPDEREGDRRPAGGRLRA